MRQLGLVGLLQLGAVLALAAPLVLFGFDWLLAGRTLLGAAFVGLATLMLLLQWTLFNPLDPGDVTEAAADLVTGDDE